MKSPTLMLASIIAAAASLSACETANDGTGADGVSADAGASGSATGGTSGSGNFNVWDRAGGNSGGGRDDPTQ